MINKLDIELLASKIDVNETLRCVCPFCNAEHERSFMLTKYPDKIVYKCWRVKCGQKGYITNSGLCSSKEQKKKNYKFLTNRLLPLDDVDYDFFEELYDVEAQNEWRWDYDAEMWAFPCYSFSGVQLGWICRTIGEGKKKVVGYWGKYEGPKYSCSLSSVYTGIEVKLAIVEDIISCEKITQYSCDIDSMALLGTNLNDGKVIEMLKAGYKDVIIMLDPDATHLSHKYKEKYGGLFNSFVVIPMEKDPKDTPREKLRELLK